MFNQSVAVDAASCESRVIRLPLPIVKRTVSLVAPSEFKKQGDISDGSSTSAGSGVSLDHESVDEWGITSPVNWRIRNTFLDSPFVKPTLLQGFQSSRRAWSAPAGGREAAEREEAVTLQAMTPKNSDSNPSPEFPMVPIASSPPRVEFNAPRPLALADLVAPQPRSKGSVLHYQGTCKPCAFFWKVVGCQYGPECEFCHLCDADERKRRNKEKRMAMHAMQAGRGQCVGAPPRHSRGGRTNQRMISVA